MRYSKIELSHILQLLAGVGVFLSEAWSWLHIPFRSAAAGTKSDLSIDVEVLVMLLLPGLLVAVGSLLQTICDQQWALIMVLIGVVSGALIALITYYVFAYVGDVSGQIAAFAGFLLILLTTPLSILHAFSQEPQITTLLLDPDAHHRWS